jgi:hypothetical protein
VLAAGLLALAYVAAPSAASARPATAARPATSSRPAVTAAPSAAPTAATPSLPSPPDAADFGANPTSLGYGLQVPVRESGSGTQPTTTFPRKIPTARFRAEQQAALRANATSAPIQTVVGGRHSTFVLIFMPVSDTVNFPTDAQDAFIRAATAWANQVYSPVQIGVQVHWEDLTSQTGDSSILGAAGPTNFYVPDIPGAPAYPSALADALAGRDFDPSLPEIDATFNSAFGSAGRGWYYGSDPAGVGNNIDLQSVVTHELGHGLGFLSSFDTATGDPQGCKVPGTGCHADTPTVFDEFVGVGSSASTPLLSYPNNSTALLNQEVSGNIYWAGTWGTVMGGFQHPKLYFPYPWQGGSSGSHLDESTYPASSKDALMTPTLSSGEIERSVGLDGPITAGMLLDLGWTHQSDYEALVRATYPDFLGRQVGTTELPNWLNLFAQGVTASQYLRTLTTSTEWLDGIFTGFYQNTLGRSPSRSELDKWENLVRHSGVTITAAGASFYASPEYFQTKAGRILTTWVSLLYQAILGRGASSSDQQFWASQAVTKGRQWVALQIYQSPENRQRRVRALYVKLLGRQPDAGGLAGWSQSLLTRDDLVLAQSLASSEEYLERAQGRYLFSDES